MKSVENAEATGTAMDQDMAGAQDTIYLCNFRVSVDGDWLCLKELQDVDFSMQESFVKTPSTPSPDEPCGFLARDPVLIERSNLLNISKLVVKELIEQSMKYGRMLDSDHMPLQHFFIVLEHVLRHGLKPKKGILGPKKELWDILQTVEKFAPEAQDITASVRDLPTVKTHMGRARAWLRLALMQKKLADYLKILLDNKDEALVDYFEPDALMLSEEAIVIIGLLVGLNVIDFNLCVKEEDLDCPQGVIDFSLYLRSSHQVAGDNEETNEDSMVTVLDQKNYIEELNRHLNATVANLQAKVEALTTTNALMKEDLAISKNNLTTLHEENRQLKKELGRDLDKLDTSSLAAKSPDAVLQNAVISTGEVAELRQRLEEERRLRKDADRELELQLCLKAEMEVAMKLLEKDIHEKQDTIISLRRQLDDIKLINLEMYKKLQESESSLRHKTELVSIMEAKNASMSETIQKLDEKYKESETWRADSEERRRLLDRKVAEHEEITSSTEEDLKVERTWRTELQKTLQLERERITQLQSEVTHLKALTKKYTSLQESYYTLKEQCLEQEQTMEELGTQLSVSKLQVSDLQEEVKTNKLTGVAWEEDSSVTHCKGCSKEFTITRRKHHCRHCGGIFCYHCSAEVKKPLVPVPVRLCDICREMLIGKPN